MTVQCAGTEEGVSLNSEEHLVSAMAKFLNALQLVAHSVLKEVDVLLLNVRDALFQQAHNK